VKLHRITLHNFKGIRDFTLDLQGRDVSIYGDNGTGKTTLFDAFTWLLFDKDSKDQAAFDVKTLDAENKPLPGLDHEVEAELDLGGKAITLKKSYKEVYTKKRGSAEATFTGHTTDYFVDGVPVKKKEYDETIAEIADESIFKLLTNPRFFNDQLHWQKRRALLLEVCGDVSDSDVIASDKALAALPDILGARSMDKHRDMVRSQMTAINKELQQIPVRIDEATRALPELPKDSRTAFEDDLKILAEMKDGAEKRRLRIESGGEVAEKKKALAELDAELLEWKTGMRVDIDAGIENEQAMVRQCQREIDGLQAEIERLEREIGSKQSIIADREKSMAEARENWKEVNAREFTFEQTDTCPTCGQALPKEQIEAARQKALADFNTKKAGDLESITAEGKAMGAEIKGLQVEIAELEKDAADFRAELEPAKKSKAEAESRLAKLEQQAAGLERHPDYLEKLAGREVLLAAITALQQGSSEELQKVLSEIVEIAARIKGTEAELAKFDARESGEARIEELGELERKLAAEYEALEQQVYLCEEFTRAKVRLLDEKINSRFELARFKLFSVLVNGGLEECCETLYGGVPWSTGMNNGRQINVGIDIINTLSKHYSFTAPIFADNAESVTEIIPTPAQLIRLVVSKPDKKLRIEYEEETK
jgi:DNA repair exonuclease SbcCD ATPase subunit